MSGFYQFYKSERLSDLELVLVYSPSRVSTVVNPAGPSAAAAPAAPAAVALPSSGAGTGRKRKLAAVEKPQEVPMEGDVEIRIPAHKFILIAMSELLSTRLETAVGEAPTASIRLFAESLDELDAMEAVVELIYANGEKLPAYCTDAVAPARGGRVCKLTLLQRLLSTLTVADQWRARSCLGACSRAICDLPEAGMTWEDCSTLSSLSESLMQQPEVSSVLGLASSLAVQLTVSASTVAPLMALDTLSSCLDKLPLSACRAILTSGRVGFTAMKVLASSEEMIADSEDHLAICISRFMTSEHGVKCTSAERVELKILLRYQHMSQRFLGLKVPHMPKLQLTASEWPQLLYLRGLAGFDKIPAACRIDTVPGAWYKAARKQKTFPTSSSSSGSSIKLTLDVSESDLSEQLAAEVLRKSSAATPPTLSGAPVEHLGVSWSLHLGYSTDAFRLFVRPARSKPGSRESVVSEQAGVYAEGTFNLQSSLQPAEAAFRGWISAAGLGTTNFTQQHGNCDHGDPLQLAQWWKDRIVDGLVRFTATVKFL